MPRRDQPSICPTVHSQKPVLEFFFFFESEIFSSSPIYSNPGFSVTTHRRRDFFDYSDSAIFQPFRTWKFFRSFGLCHFSALSDSAIFQPFRTLPFLRFFGLRNFSDLSDLEIFPPFSDSAIFQPFRTLPFFRSFGLRNFSALSDLEIFQPFSDSAIFQPFRTLPFLRLFGLGNFSALSDPDSHLYRPPIQLFTATLQAHHPGSRLGVSFCPISTPKI